MISWLPFLSVISSAILVIAADSLIKAASCEGTWRQVMYSPKMLLCYLFYLLQILLAVVIFRSDGQLAIYANLFVVFYSILGVICGMLLFQERLTFTQFVGVALGLIASYLIAK